MSKYKDSEERKWLKKMCPKGSTVYCILRRVSRSGMFRVIDLYSIKQNRPVWLSARAARVCGWSLDRKQCGVRISGCGMDMGFHLVHTLSCELYNGDGYALKQDWL